MFEGRTCLIRRTCLCDAPVRVRETYVFERRTSIRDVRV